MIYHLTDCPYCHGCVLAVDDRGPRLVVGPGSAGPCHHLSLAATMFHVTDPTRGNSTVAERSAIWMWARGSGTQLITADAADRLGELFAVLGSGRPAGHEILRTDYMVVGGCDEELDVFVPRPGRARRLRAALLGWVLFSTDPAALEVEIGQLMGCRDCGVRT